MYRYTFNNDIDINIITYIYRCIDGYLNLGNYVKFIYAYILYTSH